MVPVVVTAVAMTAIVVVIAMPAVRVAASAIPSGVLMLIAVAHPLLLDEVHRTAAGVVAAAVMAPIALVARRNVHVHRRRRRHHAGNRRDDHGLRIDQGRRRIAAADIDLAVDTR